MGANIKIKRHLKRKRRIRAKVVGTDKIPRLSVFRSNKYIYAQLIDDKKGATLISAGEKDIKMMVKSTAKDKKDKQVKGKVGRAYLVGQVLAKKALKKKITHIVFDKGGYKYHGRVKQIADGARKGGLNL